MKGLTVWVCVLCSEILGTFHPALNAIRGSITVDTPTVQTTSVHRVTGLLDDALAAGAHLKVTFPAAYKSLPQGVVPCQAGDNNPAPPTPSSCSLTNQELTVTWATVIGAGALMSFKLSLPNPQTAATLSTYQMVTYTSGGTVLNQQTSGISVTFSPSKP